MMNSIVYKPPTATLCSSLILLLVVSAGCIGTESEHPVSNVDSAKPMQKINGIWIAEDEKHPTRWEIGLAGQGFPDGMHALYEITRKRTLACYFFVTEIGNHHIVNAVAFAEPMPTTWQPNKVDGYSIFAISQTEGNLELLGMDPRYLRNSVNRGQIQGRTFDEDFSELEGFDEFSSAEPSDDENDITLTSPTKQLRHFFERNYDKVFTGDRFTLRSVKK